MKCLNYLTELIQFPSVSSESNLLVTARIQEWLTQLAFMSERVEYRDQQGVAKSCLIARKGPAGRGMAYFGHSDVVPVNSWSFPQSGPWQPCVTNNRVYGRGACDMKGSVACMLAAAESTIGTTLSAPLYIVVTADEEVGMRGAREVVERSAIYREMVAQQCRGIVGEPTSLEVVYAHKGGQALRVTSRGRAAHSSTGLGLNANLAMIPFLAEIKKLHDEMESSDYWHDNRFQPPTPTMNITVRDNSGAVNITAAECVATIYFRPMPGQDGHSTVEQIRQLAVHHGLDVELLFSGSPLLTDPKSKFVEELMAVTGQQQARTVAYGTDGAVFTELQEIAVLGPGSIDQAHTDDEWITLDQLAKGTELYQHLIHKWCLNPEAETRQ